MFTGRHPAVALSAALLLIAGLAPASFAAPPPIATTLSIDAAPSPAWAGEPVLLTFTVSPKPDGGFVRWGVNQFPVNPATGQATTTQTYPGPGTWEVTADFEGTAAYLASPEATIELLVQQHPVVALMTIPAAPVGRGDAFDIDVGLNEVPTSGTVLIQDMTYGNPGPTLAAATVTGTSPVIVHVGGLDPGVYAIRANFTGTTSYAADVTDTQQLTVFDRPTTTTASLAKDPTKWGEPTTVDITVSPVPDDGGGVKLIRDGSDQGFATMNWTTGHGTFPLAPADPGSHTVTVQFMPAGSPYRYAPSSAVIGQTVSTTPIDTDPPVATIVINDGAEIATDAYVILTIHATDASSPMSIRLSCNGGVDWETGSVVDGDQGWSISQNACPGEGPKTVTAEIKDAYGNTTVVSDSIVLENAGPVGTIILADGSSVSISPTIEVAVAASDAGSGVSLVALSNDGTTWTTRSYAPAQEWTLTPGDGVKTVHTKWRDGYGHWSAEDSDTIILDTAAPVATAPIARLAVGAALSGGKVPVSLAWTASDAGSGVHHTLLRLQTDGGAWSASVIVIGTATSRLLAPGHAYRFQVQPVDGAGRSGEWVTGATFRLSGVSQSGTAVHYHGSWANSTSALTWWGGTARFSSTAGATASYTFTGKSIAWIGLKAATRGRANVYVNGVFKATVDLYSATTLKQRVVWAANYATSATRTITIKVLGTSRRPRVDIDGFIVRS